MVFAINFGDIPANTVEPLATWVPPTLTLTINGVTQDLSTNRTWTIPDFIGTPAVSVHGLVPAVPGTVPPCTRFLNETGSWSCTGGGGSSGGAPDNAHYVTTQAESSLVNSFNLGSLTSGLLKQTVSGGVATPAIAVAGTDYLTSNQTITLTGNVTGSGTTSIVTTIPNSTITYAKMQNVSANSVLLGSSATGGGAAPSEITLGTNLSMSGSTLNASGGGGTSFGTPSANSVTISAPTAGVATTAIRSDATLQLSQAITPTMTGLWNWAFVDAITNPYTDVLTISHNTSATPINAFGTGIGFKGKDSTTNDQPMADIAAVWSNVTHGLNSSDVIVKTVQAGGSLNERFRVSGGIGVGVPANETTAGIIDASNGYTVNGVATSGKILQANGSAFIVSTPTYPLTAGTSGNVLTSDGTNWNSTPPIGGNWTGHGDSNYTILTSDRFVYTNAAFTSARQWTLPAANAVPSGWKVTVLDLQGTVTSTNQLSVIRAGTDTIFPQNTTAVQYNTAGQSATMMSDGVSKWFVTDYQAGKATGSGGQFVQFSNLGTPSLWQASTFSIPTAVGATGSIWQSNGTNVQSSAGTWPTTGIQAGYTVRTDGTNFASYPTQLSNSNTAAQSSTFAADTYITGSNVTVAAGDFKAKGVYHARFDMTKTAAGVATPILNVRIGTGASTSDTAILTFTLGAGTAATDTATFDLWVNFRSVGSGTSAVFQGTLIVNHTATSATGITSTADKALTPFALTTSSGFASNSATQLGLSFNGGTSFSGTLQQVIAELMQP